MRLMGEAFLIMSAGMGVIIDKNVDDGEHYTVWISVPEHSENRDVQGREMAGDLLASRIKEVLKATGIKNLIVKYKVCKGVYWTKQMGKRAEQMMKKSLFGSQA